MNILITGGSGFIGTHLISDLLKDESIDEIYNLDLNDSPIQDQKLKTLRVDIRSVSELSNLKLSPIFDVCIHLAALCKEPGFKWEEYFQTNHIGTIHVIKLCEKLNINRILFTSTMMVYKAGEVKHDESSVTAPDTAYGISKLLGEKELQIWEKSSHGRTVKLIRPAVVFGANEGANFTRLYRSLKKGFFPYVGKSSTVKSAIYVKEVVLFIKYLMKNGGGSQVYNLAFPEELKFKSIVKTFKTVFKFRSLNPVLPYKLLLIISYGFEFLDTVGLKNPIHHRRIQKLYFSTDITPKNALIEGYNFKYTLKSALENWKASDDPNLVD